MSDQSVSGLDVSIVKGMLTAVCDKIVSNCDYLTQIDLKIGDGDHGEGMTRGFKAVKKALEASEFDTVNNLFLEVGTGLLDSMGGASGVIFGTLFISGNLGMDDFTALTTDRLSVMLRKGFEAIRERGKAQLGDKTMLDALYPAVCAVERAAADGINICDAIGLAYNGAKAGVEDTKGMEAKKGRARHFRDKSIGYQDAGATSVMLIFEAMAEYIG